jgi:hypothetical protein
MASWFIRSISISSVAAVLARLRSRLALQAEIPALRHRIIVLRRLASNRPRLRAWDRFLRMGLLRLASLSNRKPSSAGSARASACFGLGSAGTAGQGFQGMFASSSWGAPPIHGEWLKLGIDVSRATVAKHMVRHPKPPSRPWPRSISPRSRPSPPAFSMSSSLSLLSGAASLTSKGDIE